MTIADHDPADDIRRWRLDPVAFVRECFKVDPDPWQITVLRAFATEKRIAMVACKGPGKTCVLAWMIWNFLLTRPHSNVACTSITGDNLRDGLWKELAKWQARSPLLTKAFEWRKERIVARKHQPTWFVTARSWPRSGDTKSQADALAGFHADYTLFVIDEAGGVPDGVAASAEAALASGIESKLIIAGNPTHLEGPLYRAATTQRHLWIVVEISSAPKDPQRTTRVSAEWAQQQIDQFGEDNPWVLVNVFGKFPPASLNSILSLDEVVAAMKRHYTEDQYAHQQKRLGVDVARFGDDRSVIFPRQGLVSFLPVELRHQRTTDIAARVAAGVAKWGAELILVDDTGHWGHGVIDQLITAGHNPIGVQFHAPAINPRYRNRRAEMWLEMAAWVKRGGALPDIPELVGELITPTYTFNNGRFQLEEKEQVKQRLGRSPDLADGLALTFAMPEMASSDPSNTLQFLQQQNKVVTDWDPFDENRK